MAFWGQEVGAGWRKRNHYLYKLSLFYKRGILDLLSSITGTELTNASISTDFHRNMLIIVYKSLGYVC